MNRSYPFPASRVGIAALVVSAITLPGCGSSEGTATPATSTSTAPTSATATTLTTAPVTSIAPVRETIDVSFDGNQCNAVGPNVVLSGVQSFVLEDLTDERLGDVRTMAIADDHTYQDLLDIQGEPGDYFTLPEWAEWPMSTFEAVDRDLADNETGKVLILEPGVHGIVVGTGNGIWICGALEITEL